MVQKSIAELEWADNPLDWQDVLALSSSSTPARSDVIVHEQNSSQVCMPG